MENNYFVFRFNLKNDAMPAGFHIIAANLTLDAAKAQFAEEEFLSKMFRDGTYHKIMQKREAVSDC